MCRRHATYLLMAAVMAALLALAACGDDDGATDTPRDTPPPSVTATPGPLPPNGIDLGEAAADFILETPDAGDIQAGSAALASGDFNGDGRADLAVGASFGDGPDNDREDTGEVYVLYGTASLTGETTLPADPGLVVYGVGRDEFHGFAIVAGDVNGDGTDDLILSAPGITAGADLRTDQGRVYVFFGGPDLTGTIDLAQQDPPPWDFVLTGAEGFSRAGHTIAIADVNADGTDDMVIGAPFAGREPGSPPGGPRTAGGALYVVYGRDDLSGEVNVAFDDPDFIVTNQQEFSQFAASVAVGDLNGDGIADMAAGAPQIDQPERPDAGAVFVIYGSASLPPVIDSAEADVVIAGAEEGDGLGYRLAVLPQSDGPDRLVMTATRADGPDNSLATAGDTYVFDDLSVPGPIDLAAAVPAATIYGTEAGMALGQEIAVGDVDGDGEADLVLGAPLADARDGSRRLAGRTLIVFGPAIQGVVDLSAGDGFLWIEGVEEQGQSGVAMTVADFDGDGANSLALAAARSGTSGERPGRIWVLRPTLP